MKKVKISFVLLALLFAVASAFTTSNTLDVWDFTGDPTVAAQRIDESLYTKAMTSCDESADVFCGIEATSDEGDPERPVIGTSGTLYNALYNGGASVPDDIAETFFKD